MTSSLTSLLLHGLGKCRLQHHTSKELETTVAPSMPNKAIISRVSWPSVIRLQYWDLVGGALALTPEQVVKTNGYSNVYWGWGGEDDDMFLRYMLPELYECATSLGRPPFCN